MGDFRDRCNFLTFCFSEKLFWLNKVLVCRTLDRTSQQHSSSLPLRDHLITTATLGSFLVNFFVNKTAFVWPSWTKNRSTIWEKAYFIFYVTIISEIWSSFALCYNYCMIVACKIDSIPFHLWDTLIIYWIHLLQISLQHKLQVSIRILLQYANMSWNIFIIIKQGNNKQNQNNH